MSDAETRPTAAHGPSAGYDDKVEKDDRSASQALKDSGKGVTGMLAGIHGVGEKIRGKVNAGIDDSFHEDSSRGVKTAASGDQEIGTGHFSQQTKDREALGRRHEQANTDLNRE